MGEAAVLTGCVGCAPGWRHGSCLLPQARAAPWPGCQPCGVLGELPPARVHGEPFLHCHRISNREVPVRGGETETLHLTWEDMRRMSAGRACETDS